MPFVLTQHRRRDAAVQFLRRMYQFAVGPGCALCTAAHDGEFAVCADCIADLPRPPVGKQCPICAEIESGGAICGRCLQSPPHFDATVAAFIYAFPMDRLVLKLKYGGGWPLAPTMAKLFHSALINFNSPMPDLIAPLPLHPSRERERGFNQSLEIARPLAKRLKIPMDASALIRVRAGLFQTSQPNWKERKRNVKGAYQAAKKDASALIRVRAGLSQASQPNWKARKRNVKGAYQAAKKFDGMTVALLDDVMTSGSTLNEAARALKKAGANRVINWVIARAL